MKMFLTRMGRNAKFIITGDPGQVDLPKGNKSGLKEALMILKETKNISIVKLDDIDIITSTFGKALGGASGGFISSSSEIVETLRQKSRPYLFSNSLAPPLVAACIKVFEIISKDYSYKKKLEENTAYFRNGIKSIGLDIKGKDHPIVPIMIYDAKKAVEMSEKLLEKEIYVIAFSFPVVPKDEARIRVQISASHSKKQIDRNLITIKPH